MKTEPLTATSHQENGSPETRTSSKPGDVIKGILPLAYITINLTIWILPLLLLAVIKLIVPLQPIKQAVYRLMIGFYFVAVKIDLVLFQWILNIRFEVDSLDDLQADKNYLIVSNHRSWADILVYQTILIDQTPIIKFIVKKELIFLPLVGLICWAYEYPLVHRNSIKDGSTRNNNLKTDQKILKDKLLDIGRNPTAIINFAEGSRYSQERGDRYSSPHANLLKSRTGGLFFILKTFGQQFDYLLDFTILYDCTEPIFFKFLSGKCRRVKVRVNKFPMSDLLQSLSDSSNTLSFEKVDEWLKILWSGKDKIIDRMRLN